MARCSTCGEDMAAGLKFCTRCGSPAAAAPSDARCPQCGTPQTAGKRFCTGCGAPLGGVTNQAAQLPQQPAMAPPPPGGGFPQAARPPMPTPPPGQAPYAQPSYPQPPGHRPPAATYPSGAGPSPVGGQAPAGAPYSSQGFPGLQASPLGGPPTPAKRSGGGMLVALLLLLIFGALGVGGYLAYRHLTGTPEGEAQQSGTSAGENGAATAANTAATPADTPGANRPATASSEADVPIMDRNLQSEPVRSTTSGSASTARPAASDSQGGQRASASRPSNVMDDPWVTAPIQGGAAASGKPAATASTGGESVFVPPPMPTSPPATEAPATEAAAPTGWGNTGSATPGAPATATTTSRSAATATSGVVVWSGPMRKNQTVTIDGSAASIGTVQGALPGVPVRLETDFKDIGFAEMPSRSNGWRRFALRGKMNGNVAISIRWRTLN